MDAIYPKVKNAVTSMYVSTDATLAKSFSNNYGKQFPGENMLCSMNLNKIKGEIIFELVHCPLEDLADMRHYIQHFGSWQLGGCSNGLCTINFSPELCLHSQRKMFYFQGMNFTQVLKMIWSRVDGISRSCMHQERNVTSRVSKRSYKVFIR